MKSYFIPTLALGLLVSSVNAQDKPDLTNPKQKTSYAIGVNVGSELKAQQTAQELDLDAKTVIAGITDALGGKPALTQEEVRDTLTKLEKDLQAKAEAEAAKHSDGAKNLKDGEAFLAANAKKEGIKTTASGLQYKVIKSGTGATPKATDTVKVHYHGTLIDGTVFDSSVQRGEPVTFPVGRVIAGWTEALRLMKVGDKWQLFIPAKLAYDEQSRPPKIGPNSTLLFEVELLGIEK
jgi:FKBP-type peptidyl-prolyl cis-trans isomerase FklB